MICLGLDTMFTRLKLVKNNVDKLFHLVSLLQGTII